MYTFTYKHGDRPLDGFTIERAAGRGAFGEVYFAISDAGREVALKAVQGYEQIELRGIGQCMNLKSPHLVSIFDVKYNALGRPFVIMEYVAGPNLRQILDEHPSGVGETKAAFFLREIAKGLTYLHDRGIVHRDLKPANIFYEDGYVKIGDYGLSKHIATSQHSGQTVTVGTVHYMAPEVGAGKYDRSIDIYAMGALLHELLTGVPPFVGASASEVLMKHLATEVDLKGVPEPFAATIRRALAKDPAVRFQTIQEMVESVFGAEHVREGMSVFAPTDLSMVAGRVANQFAIGASGSLQAAQGVAGVSGSSTGLFAGPPPLPGRARQLFGSVDRFAGVGVGGATDPAIDRKPVDSMHAVNRLTIGLGVMLSMSVAVGVTYAQTQSQPSDVAAPFVFFGSLASLVGLAIVWRFVLSRIPERFWFQRRLIAALAIALPALLAAIPILDHGGGGEIWIAAFAPFLLLNVPRWTDPNRKVRISGLPLLAGVALAWMIGAMVRAIDGNEIIAIGMVSCITLAVQIIWPWHGAGETETNSAPLPDLGPLPIERPTSNAGTAAPLLEVPGVLRFMWLLAAILSIATTAAIWAVLTQYLSRQDSAVYFAQCSVAVFTSVACIVKCLTKRFWNWRSYIGRSLSIYVLGVISIWVWVYTGNLYVYEIFPPRIVFFATLFTMGFVVMLFVPRRIGPQRLSGQSKAGAVR